MQKSRGLRFPPRGTKEKKLASARANLFERKELTARMKATGFQGSPREKNDTFRESKVKSGWKKHRDDRSSLSLLKRLISR